MSAARFPASQVAGDSQVTFPVTMLSPPVLYNRHGWESRRSQVGEQEETAMNGRTTGNWNPRRVGILVVVAAVVAVMAAAFRVQTYTSYSTGSASAGSAAYRQEIIFVECMRSHGAPNFPVPPPGGSVAVQMSPGDPATRAVDACKQLLPHGRETEDVRIVL
jgi:hypothetical protein